MTKNRLEAFSDGVIAIVITIMVLELKVPHGGDGLEALKPLVPVFLSYVLSFVYVGIYWNNHHHMLHAAHHVDGRVLWANLHLLFWLSLFPFTTAWVGDNPRSPWPAALYGIDLLLAGTAYYVLARALIARNGAESALAAAIGRDRKGQLSILLYAVGVPLAFWSVWTAQAIYVLVAVMWLVPDRRVEKALERIEGR